MHRRHAPHYRSCLIPPLRSSRILSFVGLSLCLLLAACGGGSGDTSPSALSLARSVPSSGILPDVDAAPALALSAPIEARTATADTVSLQGPVGPVAPRAITVDGSLVSFQPADRLAWGTSYTMRLVSPLAGSGGLPLSAPVEQTFRTPSAAWGTPVAMERTNGTDWPGVSQSAMDARGNAFNLSSLRVLEGSSYRDTVGVSRYDAVTGTWSAPQELASAAWYPVLKIDSQGNAFAAWVTQYGGTGPADIMAARYDAAAGRWSAPAVLLHVDAVAPSRGAPSTSSGYEPKLEVDQKGNALVAWYMKIDTLTGYRVRFVAAHYDAGTGAWGSVEEVAVVDGPSRWSLSMAPEGNAVLAWTEGNVGGSDALYIYEHRMRAAIFDGGARRWNAPVVVGDIDSAIVWSGFRPLLLATGYGGNAVVGWKDGDGLHVAKYSPVRGEWDPPILFPDTFSLYANTAALGIDNAGDAILVMSEGASSQQRSFSLFRSEHDTATWTGIGTIPLPDGVVASPRIVVDPADNLIITWTTSPPSAGGSTMPAMRYVRKAGLLRSYPALPVTWRSDVLHPANTDAAGNLVVMYTTPDDPGSPYAVRYSASDDKWEPPVRLQPAASSPAAIPYISGLMLVANRAGEAMAFWTQQTAQPPGATSPGESIRYFSRLGK